MGKIAVATALVVAFVSIVSVAQAHRMSGHPKSVAAKLRQARAQVWHDRQQLRIARRLADTKLQRSHQWWLRVDRAYVRRLELKLRPPSVASIICSIFGPYCSEAIRVATCESRLYTGAHNGQYLGLFQMGSGERARYGHGPDARSQTLAAHRYFLAAGGWGPWSCQP